MKPLSESQKYTLLTLLKDMAAADRNIKHVEATRIRLLGLKLDMTPEKISEAISEVYRPITEQLDAFEDEGQKKFVYQQCSLLLSADNEISPEELEVMRTIQEHFQLDPEFCENVKGWVKEGQEWERKGQELAGWSPS